MAVFDGFIDDHPTVRDDSLDNCSVNSAVTRAAFLNEADNDFLTSILHLISQREIRVDNTARLNSFEIIIFENKRIREFSGEIKRKVLFENAQESRISVKLAFTY